MRGALHLLRLPRLGARGGESHGRQRRLRMPADRELTARIRSALTLHPQLASGGIHIAASRGIVQLIGCVPSGEHRERAAALVGSIQGVMAVRNFLTLRPGSRFGLL